MFTSCSHAETIFTKTAGCILNNGYKEKIGTQLVIIGGAEDKHNERHVLRKFLTLAGGKDAVILVIPVASDFPEMAANIYIDVFENLGAKEVRAAYASSRQEAMKLNARKLFRGISGIFISGGDQMRLGTILGGTPLINQLKRAVQRGIILAGSSAGAAGLSSAMIVRGKSSLHPQKDAIRLAPGLGVLNNIIIDQHFSERTRLNRLITAVCYNPHNLGIGIDENTAVIMSKDGTLEVIGSGTVTIVDGTGITYTNMAEVSPTEPFSVFGLQLHLLTKGLKFNAFTREPIVTDNHFSHTDTEKLD